MPDAEPEPLVRTTLLGLIEHQVFADGRGYGVLSKSVREAIQLSFTDLIPQLVVDKTPTAVNIDNHEAFAVWEGHFESAGRRFTVALRHFKVRIFVELATPEDQGGGRSIGHGEIFEVARQVRSIVEGTDIVTRLIDILARAAGFQGLYSYFFVELPEYASPWLRVARRDPRRLEFELATSFFYEVLDPEGRDWKGSPRVLLIRLSHPSMVTTKMSSVTRMRLINLVYTSFLYSMRDRKKVQPDELAFKSLRMAVEGDFSDRQSDLAQERQQALLTGIQLATLVSAVATILLLFHVSPSFVYAGFEPNPRAQSALVPCLTLAIVFGFLGLTLWRVASSESTEGR